MDLLSQDAVHAVRFSVASESRYLAEFRDKYNLVVVNANIVSHMPGAVAKLVGERALRPYLIDPQTYAFQQDPFYVCRETVDEQGRREYELKKSVQKMATAYGGVLESKLTALQAVTVADLDDDRVLEEICQNVIAFQASVVVDKVASEGVAEYLEYVGAAAGSPFGLVAPYFYLEAASWRSWLVVNERMLACSRRVVDGSYAGQRVLGELVLSADLLVDPAARDAIARTYSGAGIDGILLWVDQLAEHEAAPMVLEGFVSLLRNFQSAGIRVLNLYGGFLSEILAGSGAGALLWGVCHGMEYGEDRGVVPVGGGIPMAKYYLPDLHRRIRYPEVARVLVGKGLLDSAEAFHSRVCDCATCQEVLAGNPENFGRFGEGEPVRFRRRGRIVELNYPTTEAKDLCLRHYLNRKAIEFDQIRTLTLGEIVTELRTRSLEYEADFGSSGVAHLRTWADLLDAF